MPAGYEANFHIDLFARSFAQYPRTIFFHLQKRFNKVFNSIEKQETIEERQGPAFWISNIRLAPGRWQQYPCHWRYAINEYSCAKHQHAYTWSGYVELVFFGPIKYMKQPFFKVDVLKNFAIFTGKHLFWSLFLIELLAVRPATLLKRYSNTGFFLWMVRNF